MGNFCAKRNPGHISEIAAHVEARVGKIPFSGRYHLEPKRLEDDYIMSSKVVGTGDSGNVVLATSRLDPSQRFAVKSFMLKGIGTEVLGLLKSEIKIFLSMDHPHITRLVDVYETKDRLDVVMEYMAGGDLYNRTKENTRFSEQEARDYLRQMLLALNYMHSNGYVHRDIKLENFMFCTKDYNHVKLIDFGFSTTWESNSAQTLDAAMGTTYCCAPEVFEENYTNKCDLWSLGVVAFIMLSGKMPFYGPESILIDRICRGTYTMDPLVWSNVSAEAKDFVQSLLQVDPSKRMSAEEALHHPWVVKTHLVSAEGMTQVAEALSQYRCASRFRRCCMEMLAWSLPDEAQTIVRDCFLCLDTDFGGTLSLKELRSIMVKHLQMVDELEILQIFEALDHNRDQTVHYSDFLAAMAGSTISLYCSVIKSAFQRFDVHASGFITADDLQTVIGGLDRTTVKKFIAEVDRKNTGHICFEDFSACLLHRNWAPMKPTKGSSSN